MSGRQVFCRDDDAVTRLIPEALVSEGKSTTVTLGGAELKTLNTIPVVLVPAPGSDKLIVVDKIAVTTHIHTGTGFVTGNPGKITAFYGDDVAIDDLFAAGGTFNADDLFTVDAPEVSAIDPADRADASVYVQAAAALTIPKGGINANALNAGGQDYVALEEVTLGDAIIKILTVSGPGAVLTYSVLSVGTNVAVGNAQNLVDGTGTGFKINVTTISTQFNTCQVKITTYYSVVDAI